MNSNLIDDETCVNKELSRNIKMHSHVSLDVSDSHRLKNSLGNSTSIHLEIGKDFPEKVPIHIQEAGVAEPNTSHGQLEFQGSSIASMPQELVNSLKMSVNFQSNENQRMLYSADVANQGGIQYQPSVSTREAVDPDKYLTIADEMGIVKFMCSKCGNVYKWRKSLNKHWKEKHDKNDILPNSNEPVSYKMDRFADRSQIASKSPDNHDIPRDIFNCYSCVESFHMQKLQNSSMLFKPMTNQHLTSNMQSPCSLEMKCSRVSDDSKFLGANPDVGYRYSSSGNQQLLLTGSANVFQNLYSSSPKIQNHDAFLEKKFESHSSLVCHRGSSRDASLDNDAALDLSCKANIQLQPARPSVLFDEDLPVDLSMKSLCSTVIPAGYDFATDSPSISPSDDGKTHFKAWKNGTPDSTVINYDSYERASSQNGTKHLLNCFRCCIKFSSMVELNQHFTLHHLDSLIEMVSVSLDRCGRVLTSVSQVMKNCCIVCGVSFLSTQKLAKHFDEEHPTIHPNPYQDSVRIDCQKATISKFSQNLVTDNVGVPFTENRLQYVHNDLSWKSADSLTGDSQIQRTFEGNSFPMVECSKEVASNCIFQNRWKSYTEPTQDNRYHGGHRTSSIIKDTLSESRVEPLKFLDTDKQSCANVIGCKKSEKLGRAQETVQSFASKIEKSTKNCYSKRELSNGANALPHKCEVCGFCARWPSEMNQHKKNHSDEKPFKCPNCSYRSKWKWDVGKHLKRCGSNSCKTARGSSASGKGGTYTKRSKVKEKNSRKNSSSAATVTHRKHLEWQTSLKNVEENYAYKEKQDLKFSDDAMTGMNENTSKSSLLLAQKEHFRHSGNTDQFHVEIKKEYKVHLEEKLSSRKLSSPSKKWMIDQMNELVGGTSKLSRLHGTFWKTFDPTLDDGPGKFEDKFLNNHPLRKHETEILDRHAVDSMSKGNGHCFGGIVFPGGRLKCRFCDYEAISIALFHEQRCQENFHNISPTLPNSKDFQSDRIDDVSIRENSDCDQEEMKSVGKFYVSEFLQSLGLMKRVEHKIYEKSMECNDTMLFSNQLDMSAIEKSNADLTSMQNISLTREDLKETKSEDDRLEDGVLLASKLFLESSKDADAKDYRKESENHQICSVTTVLDINDTNLKDRENELDVHLIALGFKELNSLTTDVSTKEKTDFDCYKTPRIRINRRFQYPKIKAIVGRKLFVRRKNGYNGRRKPRQGTLIV